MIKPDKLLKKIYNKTMRKLAGEWPNRNGHINNTSGLKYILIFTHPNSGSTAISQMIGNSKYIVGLMPKFEGQWLITGMCRDNKWNFEYSFNWNSIINTWNKKANRLSTLNPDAKFILEKSPPNLIRADEFISKLKPTSTLCFVRDPYSTVSSMLYRYHKAHLKNEMHRKKILTELTENWIIRNQKIIYISTKYDVPILKYEDFCKSPSIIIEHLPKCLKNSIDTNTFVDVKDYPLQAIKNYNEIQKQKLTYNDITTITEILKNSTLVSQLNYHYIN